MEHPEKVVLLSRHQQALLAACPPGARNVVERQSRPKPHFRTSAPGLKTVITANLLLVWAVCSIQL